MNTVHHFPYENDRIPAQHLTFSSLCMDERLELFDLLKNSLITAQEMSAYTKQIQQKITNISFTSLQELFYRIAHANSKYVSLLASCVRDIGCINERDAWVWDLPTKDAHSSECFASCIDGIYRGVYDLDQLDQKLYLRCTNLKVEQNSGSYKRLHACQRSTRAFTSMIRDNFANDGLPDKF